MTLSGTGVRDAARKFKVVINTVIQALKSSRSGE
ncbi:hypothetical protein EYB39_21925 [Pantoea agglomerans]|nr:hypothetical protein EYB39_21925 [Pantoea agglomerans]